MPELRVERAVRTLPVVGDFDVTVASLRARVQRDNTRAGGGFGIGLATPLAVRGSGGSVMPIPRTALGPIGIAVAMLCTGAMTREDHDMDQSDRLSNLVPKVARSEEIVRAFTAAGTGQGVVGPATSVGDRTVVPLIETIFAGGYGGGGGAVAEQEDVGGGGGGGGFARSRTVALVEITPDDVRVKPIVDTTAIVLAAIGVLAGLLGVRRRGRRH
ncbi:MAG: hypothetical protein ACT4PI_04040 [Actinomycetota bacterium]